MSLSHWLCLSSSQAIAISHVCFSYSQYSFLHCLPHILPILHSLVFLRHSHHCVQSCLHWPIGLHHTEPREHTAALRHGIHRSVLTFSTYTGLCLLLLSLLILNIHRLSLPCLSHLHSSSHISSVFIAFIAHSVILSLSHSLFIISSISLIEASSRLSLPVHYSLLSSLSYILITAFFLILLIMIIHISPFSMSSSSAFFMPARYYSAAALMFSAHYSDAFIFVILRRVRHDARSPVLPHARRPFHSPAIAWSPTLHALCRPPHHSFYRPPPIIACLPFLICAIYSAPARDARCHIHHVAPFFIFAFCPSRLPAATPRRHYLPLFAHSFADDSDVAYYDLSWYYSTPFCLIFCPCHARRPPGDARPSLLHSPAHSPCCPTPTPFEFARHFSVFAHVACPFIIIARPMPIDARHRCPPACPPARRRPPVACPPAHVLSAPDARYLPPIHYSYSVVHYHYIFSCRDAKQFMSSFIHARCLPILFIPPQPFSLIHMPMPSSIFLPPMALTHGPPQLLSISLCHYGHFSQSLAFCPH